MVGTWYGNMTSDEEAGPIFEIDFLASGEYETRCVADPLCGAFGLGSLGTGALHRYELISLDSDGLGWGLLYRALAFDVARDEMRSVRVSPDGQALTFLLFQAPFYMSRVVVMRRGNAPEDLYWTPPEVEDRDGGMSLPGDGGVPNIDGGVPPWQWGAP